MSAVRMVVVGVFAAAVVMFGPWVARAPGLAYYLDPDQFSMTPGAYPNGIALQGGGYNWGTFYGDVVWSGGSRVFNTDWNVQPVVQGVARGRIELRYYGRAVSFYYSGSPTVVGYNSSGTAVVTLNLSGSGNVTDLDWYNAMVQAGTQDEWVASIEWTGGSSTWLDNIEVRNDIPLFGAPPAVDLAAVFDQAVEDGWLWGRGRWPWTRQINLHAMRELLKAAQYFLDHGPTSLACVCLDQAYLRTDGGPWPADWVAGPAAPELAAMIAEQRETLDRRPTGLWGFLFW